MGGRLAELQARIDNLGDLQDIMAAMRALAAMRLQQAQGALPGIRHHSGILDGAMQRVLRLAGGDSILTGGGGRQAVIVFAAEHGFSGAYSDHVLDKATELAQGEGIQGGESHTGMVLVVGSRGRIKAEERRLKVAWSQPMATHLDGILSTVLNLSGHLAGLVARDSIRRVTVVYGRNPSGAHWKVETETLLPFGTPSFHARDAVAPLVHLHPDDLFDRTVEEFLFARLMHAAIESFASENAARLVAMEAAHDNIETKIDALTQQSRLQRQEEITTELLDVVIGATATRM